MGVRVAFLNPQPSGARAAKMQGVLVPMEAVRGEGAQAVVFVYAADKVERRQVTLGQTVGANRVVLSGVRDGEQVVLTPPESLKDGDTVKLAKPS